MRKLMLRFGSMAASLALVVTALNVNSACEFLIYQPKLPKGAEKLSRIN